MVMEYGREQLRQAAGFLPRHLQGVVTSLPKELQAEAEEIRLRVGRPMTVLSRRGEVPTGSMVTREDLELTLEIASQSSAYATVHQVRHGFLSLRGGHRLGLCGTCVVKEGEVTNLRQLSSLALRVAREVRGTALPLLPSLQEEGVLQSTLILSPPGRGKTTLLRDLICAISEGKGISPLRVGVADERGELAACFGGVPQMRVGLRTDVLDGCPKAQGMLMLLRGMNPQVLAVDEITAPEDGEAMLTAVGCGTILLATAHGSGMEDLKRRPLYKKLLEQGIFRRIVTIDVTDGKRRYGVCTPEGEVC